METRRCVVLGRVQGVGFRWFITRNAAELGVHGTVRNRADGAVETVLQGDAGAVHALIERIRRGPPGSRVDAIEEESLPNDARFRGFEVLR